MELRTLRYFLAAAYEGNFSRAAKSLYVSQPSLSRQIQLLEQELGCQLFVRKSHRVELTPEGLELRSRAAEILEMVGRIESDFGEHDQGISGDIHIAAAEVAGMQSVARVITRVRKANPQLHFHLHTGDDMRIADLLDKGLCDFAVICEPANLLNYHSRRLPEEDTWGVLMRADDPLAANASVTAAEVSKRAAYISRQQVSLAHETNPFRNWLGRYRGRMAQAGTLDLVRNAAAIVAEGDSLVFTFESIGGYTHDSLVFRPLSPQLTSTSVFAWKRHRTLSEASRFFLDAMKAELASHNSTEEAPLVKAPPQ